MKSEQSIGVTDTVQICVYFNSSRLEWPTCGYIDDDVRVLALLKVLTKVSRIW